MFAKNGDLPEVELSEVKCGDDSGHVASPSTDERSIADSPVDSETAHHGHGGSADELSTAFLSPGGHSEASWEAGGRQKKLSKMKLLVRSHALREAASPPPDSRTSSASSGAAPPSDAANACQAASATAGDDAGVQHIQHVEVIAGDPIRPHVQVSHKHLAHIDFSFTISLILLHNNCLIRTLLLVPV